MDKFIILIAATLINICAGGIYGWSVVSNALTNTYAYSNSQTQLIFGCCFMVNTFTMMITGRLQSKYGLKRIAFTGAILVALGYYSASFFSANYPLLLLSLGIILGLGMSCCYMVALSSVSSIFENKRGVANGIVVAGYGFGAIVLSWVFDHYIKLDYPIPEIFRKLSFTYGLLILLCFSALPTISDRNDSKRGAISFASHLKDSQYVAMIIGMFCCSFAGLIVIGNLKTISLNFGLPSSVVSLSMLFMALGNSSGRIIWGAIFDKINSKALLFMITLLALGIIGMCILNSISILYLAMVLLMTCCYGGCFSVYPSYVSRVYGVDQLGVLYPPIIVFHGLACLIAAPVGGLFYDIFGNFKASFILASLFAFIAITSHLCLLNKRGCLHKI